MKNEKIYKKIFVIVALMMLIVFCALNTYAAVGGNDDASFVSNEEFDTQVNELNDKLANFQMDLKKIIASVLKDTITKNNNTKEKYKVDPIYVVDEYLDSGNNKLSLTSTIDAQKKVSDGDYIMVLNDETHGGNTTYYKVRMDGTSREYIYSGREEDFFVDKETYLKFLAKKDSLDYHVIEFPVGIFDIEEGYISNIDNNASQNYKNHIVGMRANKDTFSGAMNEVLKNEAFATWMENYFSPIWYNTVKTTKDFSSPWYIKDRDNVILKVCDGEIWDKLNYNDKRTDDGGYYSFELVIYPDFKFESTGNAIVENSNIYENRFYYINKINNN